MSITAQTDPAIPGTPATSPAGYPPVESREPLPADKVASSATIASAAQGIHFASWGETRITQPELERLVGAVPRALAPALARRYYYFVPLVIAENETVVASPVYTVDLGDRAVCHRNVSLGSADAVFISTRLVEDRFGLAFEFFINVAHNFVDAVGVPESFAAIAWSQAQANVRGETSHDAWETRRRALDSLAPATDETGKTVPSRGVDERARKHFEESAFSDSLAIYMLSLALDFEYHDLREREYPLLAAPALAERLRHVASLFPPNESYDFQILYRGKH